MHNYIMGFCQWISGKVRIPSDQMTKKIEKGHQNYNFIIIIRKVVRTFGLKMEIFSKRVIGKFGSQNFSVTIFRPSPKPQGQVSAHDIECDLEISVAPL